MLKFTLIASLSIVLLIVSCKKDSMEYQDEYAKSLQTFQSFKSAHNNTYQYQTYGSSWTGISWKTTIIIRNGAVVERSYLLMVPTNVDLSVEETSWTETGGAIGTHTKGSDPVTIDAIYDSARSWLSQKDKNNDYYFETKNDGMISVCGIYPKGCQDDCFSGIKINYISSLP